MVAKKIIVWGGSGAFGLVAGFGTVFALGTTVQKYAVDLNFGVLDLVINNLFFLCLAYAAFVWIWLDYFLGTKILPRSKVQWCNFLRSEACCASNH